MKVIVIIPTLACTCMHALYTDKIHHGKKIHKKNKTVLHITAIIYYQDNLKMHVFKNSI